MWPFRRKVPDPFPADLPPHRGVAHRALYDRFVPEGGQAETLQGELLRSATRISHEMFSNGGMNWDEDYDRFAAEVRTRLTDGTFGPRTVAFVNATVDQLLASAAWYRQRDARLEADPDADEDDPPAPREAEVEDLFFLEQLTELWCNAHPEPILRQHDPRMRR